MCAFVHVREEKNVALNKSCPVCLNCSIKTIFVFDTEEEKKSKLTEHGLDVSLRWRGFCCFVLIFFKFCFSLLSSLKQWEGVGEETRATVPEPRGPQEPWGVPTLMEAWASLEQIAWWGQKHTATTAPLLLAAPSQTNTDSKMCFHAAISLTYDVSK